MRLIQPRRPPGGSRGYSVSAGTWCWIWCLPDGRHRSVEATAQTDSFPIPICCSEIFCLFFCSKKRSHSSKYHNGWKGHEKYLKKQNWSDFLKRYPKARFFQCQFGRPICTVFHLSIRISIKVVSALPMRIGNIIISSQRPQSRLICGYFWMKKSWSQ